MYSVCVCVRMTGLPFYSLTVVSCAGAIRGMILGEGACVLAEELSCSHHSNWDSTSFLLLSPRQLSGR